MFLLVFLLPITHSHVSRVCVLKKLKILNTFFCIFYKRKTLQIWKETNAQKKHFFTTLFFKTTKKELHIPSLPHDEASARNQHKV